MATNGSRDDVVAVGVGLLGVGLALLAAHVASGARPTGPEQSDAHPGPCLDAVATRDGWVVSDATVTSVRPSSLRWDEMVIITVLIGTGGMVVASLVALLLSVFGFEVPGFPR